MVAILPSGLWLLRRGGRQTKSRQIPNPAEQPDLETQTRKNQQLLPPCRDTPELTESQDPAPAAGPIFGHSFQSSFCLRFLSLAAPDSWTVGPRAISPPIATLHASLVGFYGLLSFDWFNGVHCPPNCRSA